MRIKKIKVPFYKWEVICMIAHTLDDKEAILKKMRSLHMRSEDIEEIEEQFNTQSYGGATIYYNSGLLLSVIIVLPHLCIKDLVSTLIHEGRHAADKIIDTAELEGPEAAAYLNTYITMELIKDYIKEDEVRS